MSIEAMSVTLQLPGLLGGPEILLFFLLMAVVGIAVGRWVYRDAKSRGSNWAWQWGVGIAILLIPIAPGFLALAIYILIRGNRVRGDEKQSTQPQDQRREFALTLGALAILALFIGSIMSPPDSLTQIYYVLPLSLLSPVLAYWLVYRNGYRYIRGAR
jgi:Na+/H+ antiporter NhaC